MACFLVSGIIGFEMAIRKNSGQRPRRFYPPPTPLLMAAELGICDGGVMRALFNAGADTNDAKAACNDSVLMLLDGNTPLLLALMGKTDAIFQAKLLFDYGANIYVGNSRGENVFGVTSRNKFFIDEDSASHIKTLLLRLDYSAELAFQAFEESSKAALLHQELCSVWKDTRSQVIGDSSYQLYDDKQGGPKREREAYWAFPITIEILRKHGAKRAGNWDRSTIVRTLSNQRMLYELANYKPTWMKEQLDLLLPWYDEGTFRPGVDVLKNWPELCEELQKMSEDGWIKASSTENLMVEVRVKDGTIVESKGASIVR
ncbi:uncharacterized protein PAC_06103 [Phialocephala subalpina]|uniref:Uncharacterized protein n=1 Tax=Phialocephala subalpina TaxID=576137 RepID=A0A1L7WTV9_9HELO|nr:uncharacterized protein PAC_06103 [Phialocephala subalpina]